jgi:hypothetical protein
MLKGHEFSQDMKQIFFKVIKFVEKEKFGPVILLFNVNERLPSMLDSDLFALLCSPFKSRYQ